MGYNYNYYYYHSSIPYYLVWLVGNGRMVVIVAIIVPHSSIPY